MELDTNDLKTYCKEMIPDFDCSNLKASSPTKTRNELIKVISNKINIETGDLFCDKIGRAHV